MATLKRTLFIIIIAAAFYAGLSTLLATKKPIHEVTFTQAACIKPHSKVNYLTCSPLVALIDDIEIIVPKNFNSDLASIPHWFWSILAPEYAALAYPSLLHDYMYTCPGSYTRLFADEVFYASMLKEGMSPHTASKVYWAVRWFGGWHFNADNVCEDY